MRLPSALIYLSRKFICNAYFQTINECTAEAINNLETMIYSHVPLPQKLERIAKKGDPSQGVEKPYQSLLSPFDRSVHIVQNRNILDESIFQNYVFMLHKSESDGA